MAWRPGRPGPLSSLGLGLPAASPVKVRLVRRGVKEGMHNPAGMA